MITGSLRLQLLQQHARSAPNLSNMVHEQEDMVVIEITECSLKLKTIYSRTSRKTGKQR
jgi:hypothetical protein